MPKFLLLPGQQQIGRDAVGDNGDEAHDQGVHAAGRPGVAGLVVDIPRAVSRENQAGRHCKGRYCRHAAVRAPQGIIRVEVMILHDDIDHEG